MKNYSIDEKVQSGERNINKAHCLYCDEELLRGEGYRVFIPSLGKRVVCPKHYATNGLLSYHGNKREREDNGSITIGTPKKLPLTKTPVGVEVETKKYYDNNSSEYTTLRMLLQRSFVVKAESDITVSAEFPTEKMQGLATISKVLQSMENHGLIKYVKDNDCGAHIHVQCDDILYVRRYYHSLFIPLFNYINNLSRGERIRTFGSDWRYYASQINTDTNPMVHENFVNVQHNNTIEFRLPRIIGYKQYMQVIKFWREVGYYINNFDFDKTNPDNNIRVSKAMICGVGIVNIAKKYFE